MLTSRRPNPWALWSWKRNSSVPSTTGRQPASTLSLSPGTAKPPPGSSWTHTSVSLDVPSIGDWSSSLPPNWCASLSTSSCHPYLKPLAVMTSVDTPGTVQSSHGNTRRTEPHLLLSRPEVERYSRPRHKTGAALYPLQNTSFNSLSVSAPLSRDFLQRDMNPWEAVP
jgi:hypothetical protein